jgi:drug/metabolite transporter (DMT)-like permease
MPLLKRRPTLGNWLLVAAFLGVVLFIFQNALSILGIMLGSLIVGLYGLIYLVPVLISWIAIGVLVLGPFLLLFLLLLWWLKRRKRQRPGSAFHW